MLQIKTIQASIDTYLLHNIIQLLDFQIGDNCRGLSDDEEGHVFDPGPGDDPSAPAHPPQPWLPPAASQL